VADVGVDASAALTKVVLAPVYVSGEEAPDAGSTAPEKKKGCGCASTGGGFALAALSFILLLAFRRSPRRA